MTTMAFCGAAAKANAKRQAIATKKSVNRIVVEYVIDRKLNCRLALVLVVRRDCGCSDCEQS